MHADPSIVVGATLCLLFVVSLVVSGFDARRRMLSSLTRTDPATFLPTVLPLPARRVVRPAVRLPEGQVRPFSAPAEHEDGLAP